MHSCVTTYSTRASGCMWLRTSALYTPYSPAWGVLTITYRIAGNFHGVLISLFLWFIRQVTNISIHENYCLYSYVQKADQQGAWPRLCGSMARSCSADPSIELSLCRHYHPADGTFNSRDTLVHTISPNILQR